MPRATIPNFVRFGVCLFSLATMLVLISAPAAHAISKCKVKVDNKTGVILVDAQGIGGPLVWGSSSSQVDQTFFNDLTCNLNGKAKKCLLADPATVEARTPPDGCTIYVDDGVAECSAWIRGCTPGLRSGNSSTLGGLSCSAGQVAMSTGSGWECSWLVTVDRIDGVVASSPDMGTCCSGGFPALTDGSGLSTLDTSASHDSSDSGQWKSNLTLSGELIFDLGGTYLLNQIAVWNSCQLGGDRGVRGVSIEASSDGVNYTAIAGTPTEFAEATSCASPAAVYSFSPVEATHVRFNITSGWGALNVGIGEVFFGYVE